MSLSVSNNTNSSFDINHFYGGSSSISFASFADRSKTFRVIVPNGVSKGDKFEYDAGGEIGPIMIIVPDTADSGSVLEIKIVSSEHESSSPSSLAPDLISNEDNEENEVEDDADNDNETNNQASTSARLQAETAAGRLNEWRKEMIKNSRFALLRISAEVLVFLCLTLSYTLQPYANVSFSNLCHMRNVKDNSTITSLYFNMWRGLSTDADSCSNSGGNFCIRWSNEEFWNSFNDTTRYAHYKSIL